MNIGLVGLGIMGKPMARNMMKAGYSIKVFDIVSAAVDEIVAAGAIRGESTAEIGATCDVVITMLPNSPHVQAVVLGEGGLVTTMKSGGTVIDMSSINPSVSQEVAKGLEKIGVELLDAPVSGGEPKAIDGTLSIMVGGKKEVFDRFLPLLKTMGASVVHCGDIGAGNTTKLANQIVVALNIAALSEALLLADMAGVDPNVVFNAIRGGLAGSTVMDAKAPMMIAGNYKPGFRIDLHIKDLENALSTGHLVGAPLPLTASVMEILQNLRKDGCGSDDHSAIAKFYEKMAGKKIGRD